MRTKEPHSRSQRVCLWLLGIGLVGALAVVVGSRMSLFRPPEGTAPTETVVLQTSAYHPVEANEGREGFELPADDAGKLLAQLLPPWGEKAAEEPKPRHGAMTAPREIDVPAAPLPSSLVEMPTLPRPHRKGARAALLLDEVFDDVQAPILPQMVTFLVGPGLHAEDDIPVTATTMSPLAQPVPDRAPVHDMTAEASTAAALAAPMPVRRTLAPFSKLTVPDPYERRRALDLPTLEEDATPQAGSPQTPGQR